MKERKRRKGIYKEVLVEDVLPPEGRQRMEIDEDEIKELMDSIETWGLRQAIEVVPRGEKYEIVYGERRWIAHKRMSKEKIRVQIVDLNREEMVLVRATENIPRAQLSPVEEAAVFGELQERFNMTVEQISKQVGMKVGTVKRRLDILKMPTEFQKAIHIKAVSNTVAEELWRCPNEAHRLYLLDLAIDHGITAAIARQWVNDYLKEQRVNHDVNREGGGDTTPMRFQTSYQACQICDHPVKIEEMIYIGMCSGCRKAISDAQK